MTQTYYGTKKVEAWPEEKENGEQGYAVKYKDGYISWSPKETFEEAYQPIHALSFGHAIEAMRAGHRVCRAGWNGKGMWLCFVIGDPDLSSTFYEKLPYIGMKTADNKFVPWLASQTDMLANDWQILPEKEKK